MTQNFKMQEKLIDENMARANELNRITCEQIDGGNLESARENLVEAIDISPKLAAPHTNLGVLFCWEGEFNEAIDLHLKACSFDPTLSDDEMNIHDLEILPITVPMGAPAAWCEIAK